ncbi:MAG: PfkB family carbohydrate kinase [Chloroflexota bacterium]
MSSDRGAEEGQAEGLSSEALHVDYLLVGTVCIDLVGKKTVLGGSVTYSALTARNLGLRVGVLTSADFEPGIMDVLVGPENLREAATDLRVARLPAEATTCFVNTYTPNGRVQELRAVANVLRAEHVPPEWRDASLVHLAPLAQDVSLDMVAAFPNALMGVTPQGWMRGWDEAGHVHAIEWEGAELVLRRADAVILSEEDVPNRSYIERYAALCKLLVVTEHRHGAVVYERGKEPYRSAAFKPSRETDPTGAGDVFAAAFLTRYLATGDPRASADFANCVASFSIERRGWLGIPTLAQTEQRLKRGKRRTG